MAHSLRLMAHSLRLLEENLLSFGGRGEGLAQDRYGFTPGTQTSAKQESLNFSSPPLSPTMLLHSTYNKGGMRTRTGRGSDGVNEESRGCKGTRERRKGLKALG